jgi:hypothetical protein
LNRRVVKKVDFPTYDRSGNIVKNEVITSVIIYAPWTDDEVESLNQYQRSGVMHPFTCGRSHSSLIATNDGWICPNCEYTQDWCHEFMCYPDWKMENKMKKCDRVVEGYDYDRIVDDCNDCVIIKTKDDKKRWYVELDKKELFLHTEHDDDCFSIDIEATDLLIKAVTQLKEEYENNQDCNAT